MRAKKPTETLRIPLEFQNERHGPEERTQPNIRLVKTSPVVALTRAKAANFHRPAQPVTFGWLPYLFGGLLAFGFVVVQKSNAVKTGDGGVLVSGADVQAGQKNAAKSGILELARISVTKK